MMLNLKKVSALALAAALSIGGLAGCDTSGGDGQTTQTSGGGDKILKYGASSFDGKFISILSDNVYDSQVNNLVFEKLVIPQSDGSWVTWLAEGYTMENDNHTYVFTLKDGIKFSDGEPLTTEDVYFTFATAAHKDYDGPRSYIVSDLVGYDAYHSGQSDKFEGIEIIDEKTIAFTFNNASPVNIEYFNYGIFPKHYYDFDDYSQFIAKISEPIGSGCVVMADYEPGQYIELAKNPNYWDPDNEIQIDGVLISIIPNETRIAALQTGQVDFVEPDVTPENWEALKELDNAYTYNFVGNGYIFLCFNTVNERLSDTRVRQALMYAVDRQAFVEAQFGELGEVGAAPVSPVSWASPDKSQLNYYEFDLDKARELMGAAGWEMGASGFLEKDGETFTINWLVYTDTDWPSTISGMAADTWGQLGVDLQIDLMDFNTVSARTFNAPIDDRDWDIFTMGFNLSIDPDPTGGLFDYNEYVEGGFCASGYYNERAEELIYLGRTEFDQEKRKEIYQEWALLMNEQIPTVILAHRYPIWGISNRVSGLEISAYCDWSYSIRDITISE